jgi:hypothetical protein
MTPSGPKGGVRAPWWTLAPASLVLALLVLAAGIVLRFLYLDADPHYYEWWGYVTDEGRWVTHARELALFGHVLSVDWTLHLMLAPLFQAVSYVAFQLFGVSVLSARLFTALCSSGVLVVAWILLRRVATPPALLLAMVVLAFDWDFLVLSRVAIPEVAVMLVHLLVYALVVSDEPRRGRLFFAGLVEGVAIGVKATALPVAGIWAVVIAARLVREVDVRRAWYAVAWYLGGLALPAAMAGIGAALCCLSSLDGIVRNAKVLQLFLATGSLYDAVAFFFESTLSASFACWALGVWLATFGRLAASPATASVRQKRYFDVALLWALGYTVVMLSLSYFPNRYKIHAIVPMAICIGVGVTMLEAAGVTAVGVAANQSLRGLRVACAAWLALPTAVVLAPGLAPLAALAGTDASRLRVKIACLAVALAVVAWIALRRSFEPWTVRALLLFPVTATLAWLALREAGGGLFWRGDPAHSTWQWSVATALALAVAAAASGTGRWVPRAGTVLTAGAIAYVMLSLIRIAPGYLEPRYTIRDTSAALGRVLSDYTGAVGTIDGEGLFNSNRLRYTSIVRRELGPAPPDALVIVGEIEDPADVLRREYRAVAAYRLYVAPDYLLDGPGPDKVIRPGEGLVARVWRRRTETTGGNSGPRSVLETRDGVLRLNFIHAARPRTPAPAPWIPYDGSRYTAARGFGWLQDVPDDPGGGADRGPDAAIVLADGTRTSPRALGRPELSSWQGNHRENELRVFRLDAPDGWYRVSCASVDPGTTLPLIDVRGFKCRAHDAVFAGPRYGPPMRIKGADLVEGEAAVEVTDGHLRIVVGDAAYAGWTWRYGGPWWRGWSSWFAQGGPHFYAEDWRGKLTRVVDPGFHSLRLNALRVAPIAPPVDRPEPVFRDFFNRDDAADVNVGLAAAAHWTRLPGVPGLAVTLDKTSMRMSAAGQRAGEASFLQRHASPADGLVRYSTSVSLLNGEGSRSNSGRHEAGIVLLANPAEPADGTATFVGVVVGPGGGGLRVGPLAGPVGGMPPGPLLELGAGEFEIIVEHDVGRNVLTRIEVNGRDLTSHVRSDARRPGRPLGLFGIRGSIDPADPVARLAQSYWFFRVDRVVATNRSS